MVEKKKNQLEKFSESLKEYGYSACDKLETWNDAFNALKEVIKASKQEKNNIY